MAPRFPKCRSATWRAPRTVGMLSEQEGVQIAASATGGYMFDSELVLALTASYASDLPPRSAVFAAFSDA